MIRSNPYHHTVIICDQCGNAWKNPSKENMHYTADFHGSFKCPKCNSRKTHFARNSIQTKALLKRID